MGHEIPRFWRLQKQRYSLIGEECDCGIKIFPPRDICPNCSELTKTQYNLSGKGAVYSFSTVYYAPEGFEEQIPYTIALIQLAEGPIITAQLTDIDNDKVKIGMPVEMVTRKLNKNGNKGIINYGYKFRPPLQPKGSD